MNVTVDSKMPKRIADEIYRVDRSVPAAARRLACRSDILWDWVRGEKHPSAAYLKRLYENGYDIIFILTGRRSQGGDSRA